MLNPKKAKLGFPLFSVLVLQRCHRIAQVGIQQPQDMQSGEATEEQL